MNQEDSELDERVIRKVVNETVAVTAKVIAKTAVASIRDAVLSLQPSLQDDLDHLIEQLKELSDDYLRAVWSDPESMCEELGVVRGKVSVKTVEAIARGALDDRHRDDDRGTQWWVVGVTAFLGVVGMLIVYAVTGGK